MTHLWRCPPLPKKQREDKKAAEKATQAQIDKMKKVCNDVRTAVLNLVPLSYMVRNL